MLDIRFEPVRPHAAGFFHCGGGRVQRPHVQHCRMLCARDRLPAPVIQEAASKSKI
ncbi:MAG: hypothetical protein JGK24_26120 [Microcoleus sp. PH2017_29_MFU_D_A]|uniref:hypothetical protein n=1 Tax=unclassified Microcoleus TaxID=2642155 RepID=UPI001DEA7EAB|nr:MULTISPECIES: hypothetical protein [unclassified Microcoleus]MCC3421004.1 hypothetical protein [Microcoleus sp. PH2017_07_MST_O_A]MCC3430222.1 hypothetical protein [Microcoleus sp. PH2017_04_SCI_O_A]MCC3445113.1 hypothetical protein [Microcoleus sp. PH2017_03_ELD_O_A]MCC3469081.1 hypothetical protein [Microcoleus sp. PH2017_06_SFM_O_A]MCC3505253.1 hypothetical protein [Microcoleus sp. PH2017_19_SFW_U_A]MCC3511272.1 hypothetical protein [Microcoleus sp. PH2017_17_BER_D_A]